tara:strand:+ start:149 stop:340 length:192 start_codon:yes stop_codon:yes gene_type:complete
VLDRGTVGEVIAKEDADNAPLLAPDTKSKLVFTLTNADLKLSPVPSLGELPILIGWDIINYHN